MREIERWFRWLVIIGPIHMLEQMLFGIDEFRAERPAHAVLAQS